MSLVEDKVSRLHNEIAAVCPIQGVSVPTIGSPVGVRIDFDPAATGAQQTAAQAVLAVFDWSDAAQLTVNAQQAKAQATTGIDTGALQAGDKQERLMVAVVELILDEFNLHALKINAILDAVDGAVTLAALKTAVALIADYPQRTKAQLITAIKAKIAATGE